MESADQAVAEVSIALAPNLIHYSVKPIIYTLFSQLNGSTVGDVPIKVSIARKQPMLEAATGKSVWATLGKYLSQTQIRITSSVTVSTLDSCILSLPAVQNSAKGSYRDKRNQVVYSEDFL